MNEELNEEMKEVVEKLKANDNRLTGEDGGVALMTLQELAVSMELNEKRILYTDIGLVNYGMGQLCKLVIQGYIWGDYKFVVQESIEKDPHSGGTIYYATVDLYNNGDPQ